MSFFPNHRILVIDDTRAIHDDFRKILTRESSIAFDEVEANFFGETPAAPIQPNFEIQSAYQGEEGVELLRESMAAGRGPAVVFLDVRMPPGIDGVETAERLWEVNPNLEIVICTAHSDYSWEEMVQRLGNRDRLLVLKKPFTSIEVLQLACALTAKWDLARQSRERLIEIERLVAERTRELRESNERLESEMKQRLQAEQHLLRAQRLESIGTLASGIAHDLNNMISPIMLSSQLLRAELPAKDRSELLDMIESSASRAAGIVRQVLTFARGVEGRRLPLQPRALIREMEKMATETFPRCITLQTHIAEDLQLIEGDTTQLHQVLMNLCVNARDAMPMGGVLTIEADNFTVDESYACMTPGARVGNYVRIRVSDSGTGIPAQILDKIFDPFFTTKPLGKGTGLGLSTVVGIVKSHEGFLDVKSTTSGSIFEVFLPSTLDAAALPPESAAVSFSEGSGELILVVDDEVGIRQVTETVLTRHGYRVIVAADGAEGLSQYARRMGEIDVVITDLMMPVVDGVALCHALKKINPGVRIIASTGCENQAHSHHLQALNVCHVLSKPFDTPTLLNVVRQALRPHTTTPQSLAETA